MILNRMTSALFILIGLVASGALAEAPQNNPGGVTPLPTEGIILGQVDNRVPSDDPRVGRLTGVINNIDYPFCTGWLLSNGAFLTAGHCATTLLGPTNQQERCPGLAPELQVIEFNVPESAANGETVPSRREDRYPIRTDSVQCRYVKLAIDDVIYKKDWALFAVGLNPYTSEFPVQRQRGFFRPTRQPIPKNTQVRVTGFGVAGPPPSFGWQPPRNRLSKTQLTGEGSFFDSISAPGGFDNLQYAVDTSAGSSGGPVYLSGTSLALGIHRGFGEGFNEAMSFHSQELATALHNFPGTLLAVPVAGGDVLYVDGGAPGVVEPDGNLFSPFLRLTDAFAKIDDIHRPTLISVVTGSYPEQIDQNTGLPEDIDVFLQGSATLLLPVGSVAIWGEDGAAPG